MGSPEHSKSRERAPVSEREDEKAEAKFVKEEDIQEYKEMLVHNFNLGIDVEERVATEFKTTLSSRLSDLISVFAEREINVRTLDEIGSLEPLKANLRSRMDAFIVEVEAVQAEKKRRKECLMKFVTDPELEDYKKRIVDNFDFGSKSSAEVEKTFKTSLADALDDIIKSFAIKRDQELTVMDFTEDKLDDLRGKCKILMDDFEDKVKKEVSKSNIPVIGEVETEHGFRDISDVRSALAAMHKKKFFLSKEEIANEFSSSADVSDIETATDMSAFDFINLRSYVENVEELRSAPNDATISLRAQMSENGKTVDSVTLNYSNPEKPSQRTSMTLISNDKFFDLEAKSPEDSLAGSIKENREAYLIPGANYDVKNPAGFKDFIKKELGEDLSNLNPENAITAAVEIVKRNLKMADDADDLNLMEADKVPIDQLIMNSKEKSCCRHYTAATTVVFEYIQKISAEAENDQLSDIVMFENHMPLQTHGTVAIARGNSVTVVEPTWYANKEMPKYKKGKKGFDATFSTDHGSMLALYQTLSKHPKGRPDLAIFDNGNADAFVDSIYKNEDISREVRNLISDGPQAILYITRQNYFSGKYLPKFSAGSEAMNSIGRTLDVLEFYTNDKVVLSGLNPVSISRLEEINNFAILFGGIIDDNIRYLEKILPEGAKIKYESPTGEIRYITKERVISHWKKQKFIVHKFISEPIHARIESNEDADKFYDGSYYKGLLADVNDSDLLMIDKQNLRDDIAIKLISSLDSKLDRKIGPIRTFDIKGLGGAGDYIEKKGPAILEEIEALMSYLKANDLLSEKVKTTLIETSTMKKILSYNQSPHTAAYNTFLSQIKRKFQSV